MTGERSRFVGMLELEGDEQLRVQRTDGGGAVGPFTLNLWEDEAATDLDSWEMYPIGRQVEQIDGAHVGATVITMHAGHGIKLGDRVTVLHIAGNGVFECQDNLVTASAPLQVRLTSAITCADHDLMFPTFDLIAWIEARVRARHANLDSCRWAINTNTGILTLSATAAGVAITYTWAPGGQTRVRDWLRIDDATTSFVAPATASGDACVYGSFYPSKGVEVDKPDLRTQTSQAIGVDGTVETHHYAVQTRHRITYLVQGSYRIATYADEVLCYRDHWLHCLAPGRPFLWYPDRVNVVAPYLAPTPFSTGERWGWRRYVHVGPQPFFPRELRQGWYEWSRVELDLMEQPL